MLIKEDLDKYTKLQEKIAIDLNCIGDWSKNIDSFNLKRIKDLIKRKIYIKLYDDIKTYCDKENYYNELKQDIERVEKERIQIKEDTLIGKEVDSKRIIKNNQDILDIYKKLLEDKEYELAVLYEDLICIIYLYYTEKTNEIFKITISIDNPYKVDYVLNDLELKEYSYINHVIHEEYNVLLNDIMKEFSENFICYKKLLDIYISKIRSVFEDCINKNNTEQKFYIEYREKLEILIKERIRIKEDELSLIKQCKFNKDIGFKDKLKNIIDRFEKNNRSITDIGRNLLKNGEFKLINLLSLLCDNIYNVYLHYIVSDLKIRQPLDREDGIISEEELELLN